jgi:hypothetical protein
MNTKNLLTVCYFLSLSSVIAQTNSFPSSGNVGIGIINPIHEELEIKSTSSAAGIIVERVGAKYGKLISGVVGAGFLFSNDGVFGIGPSTDISASGPIESGLFVVYGNAHPNYPGQAVFGSWTPGDNSKVSINGRLRSEEIKVVVDISAPDYVFKEDYKLRSLDDLKSFISENGHLPEIPSANEFKENGILVGQMSFDLLKKIEELTLYILDLNSKNEILSRKVFDLEKILNQKNSN